MKKTIFQLSLLAAVACQAAYAQSVQVYGTIDSGVEIVNGVGVGQLHVTRIPGLTGTFPSRFGLRGSEDLGGGLNAVFLLENGFTTDTGQAGQGGRLFGRQAFVGLNGSWGSLTFGRQYTMLTQAALDADIMGPNLYGAAALDPYIPNSRVDNSIAYKGVFSGVTVGATYSLGRDVVDAGPSPAGTNCAGESGSDSRACREWSALLKYDTASWGAALSYDQMRGRTPTGPADLVFGGLNSSAKKDARTSVHGYYKFADFKVGAGTTRRANDGDAAKPVSRLSYVGASYPVTPALTIDGQVFRQAYAAASNFNATLMVIRGVYSLSKRTAVYAQTGHISNGSASTLSVSAGQLGANPGPGGSQTGVMIGIRHTF